MKTSQVNAYVPASAYLEGKQETVTPRFYEDFAILNPTKSYSVIASRGLTLKADGSPKLSPTETDFLETHLNRHFAVALDTDDGILLVFHHLHSHCGLLPVALLHDGKAAAAYALQHVYGKDILLSPAVASHARACIQAEEAYAHLTQLLQFCENAFTPPLDFDFRLHCAHVAQLAGCKVNVTDLPTGHYPILQGDFVRWTAFLLCLFLTLRGDSSLGTAFHLEHADYREFTMKISHQSEYERKIPITESIYQFLDLPPFSDFRLSRSGNRFSIQAVLRRQHSAHLLRANDSTLYSVFYIDLTA